MADMMMSFLPDSREGMVLSNVVWTNSNSPEHRSERLAEVVVKAGQLVTALGDVHLHGGQGMSLATLITPLVLRASGKASCNSGVDINAGDDGVDVVLGRRRGVGPSSPSQATTRARGPTPAVA